MSLVTALAVDVDRSEYCKLESGRDVVTVTIVPTPADATIIGEVLTIELRKARRNRDVAVTSQTYTVPVTYAGGAITATFDLPEIVAVPEGWSLLRRGMYFVYVESADALPAGQVTAESADFRLVLMSVEKLKETYLFGLTLTSYDTRKVKYQPSQITGVTIKEVSRGHPVTYLPLRYEVEGAVKTLSWCGGTLMKVTSDSARQTIMLPGSRGSEYIAVEVNPLALPTTDTSELIYVDLDTITDQSIQDWIDRACDYLENEGLLVYLEPTVLVTDTDPTAISFAAGMGLSPVVLNSDYDFIKFPLTFYPRAPAKWIDIQFPFPYVLRVDSLFGAVANTRIVDINLEWIEIAELSGFTQIVPFNQEVAFDYLGLAWVEALRGNVELPNFWHYTLVAGLRQVPGEILDLIGWKAAIPALTAAGQAYRGGYSSQSISRDGVSESVSYTSSAIYGMYSASIEDCRKNIKETLKKIRQKYSGLSWTVV